MKVMPHLVPLVTLLLVLGQPVAAETLRVAAGPPGSGYDRLARELGARLPAEAPGWELEVISTTEGSYDNVRLMREGRADLAFSQSDVAYLEYFEDRSYRALAGLFVEPVHIIARRELGLRQLSDLELDGRRFRVSIGAAGSGTASQALRVLDELRLPPDRLEVVELDLEAALSGLRQRDLDLAFLSAPVPTPELGPLASEGSISLLPIDKETAGRLLRHSPYLSQSEIPYEAYEVSRTDTATVGARTLLLARRDLPARAVEALLDTLYLFAAGPLPDDLSFVAPVDPAANLRDLAIPLHPTARLGHRTRSSPLSRIASIAERYAVPILILVLPLVLLLRVSKIAYLVHQYLLGRLLLLLLLVWLMGSSAMYLIEGSRNSSFHSLGQSGIAILHYLTSGLESKYPITLAGNLIAILMLTIGVAVVTIFTGTVVSLLLERMLNVRRLPAKPWRRLKLESHLVLVGWTRRTHRLLQLLHGPEIARQRPPIVVVTDDAAKTQLEPEDRFRNTWVVEGERGDRTTLERADLDRARLALVMSDREPEHRYGSISAALALEQVAPRVHSVVEIRDEPLAEHARSARADEIVNTALLGERLLSQCVISPGIQRIYDELLTFSRGSQEIYIVDVPPELDGVAWTEVRERLLDRWVVPLGYRTASGRTVLGPRHDHPESFQCLRHGKRPDHSCDALVVLADHPRELRPRRRGWIPWRRLDGGLAVHPPDPPPEKGAPMPIFHPTSDPDARSHDERPTESRLCLCGWSPHAHAVLDQLQAPEVAARHRYQIQVISDRHGEPLDRPRPDESIRFVVGDPTRRRVLESAGLTTCDHLVILATGSDEHDRALSDHRTLMITLAALDVHPGIHIVAEVLESRHREHFEHLPNVEVVSVEDLAEKLLAQTVISPGISRVFLDLLTASDDTNEIYFVPLPDAWVGRTFEELYLTTGSGPTSACLLGYTVPSATESRPSVILNPSPRRRERRGVEDWRQHVMAAGERLVVLAWEEPSWAERPPAREGSSRGAAPTSAHEPVDDHALSTENERRPREPDRQPSAGPMSSSPPG